MANLRGFLLALLVYSITVAMATEEGPVFKFLVTHPDLPEEGMKMLRDNEFIELIVVKSNPPQREEILRLSQGVDAIVWATHEKLNAEALDAAGPNLKALTTMSAGLDYVDLPEVRRRKIPIGFTPMVLDDAVADMAVGLMIAAGRRFHEGRLKIESSNWISNPRWMLGQDIKSRTVGIVGFGNIGQTVAKRLQGFDLNKILYSGHKPKPEAEALKAEFVSFDDLLTRSDYVIITAPLTNETRNMFNQTAFAKMKPTSVLINVARGQIVNTADLVTALKTGQIFAAGLDVMDPEPLPADHELMKLPNAIIVPHLGSATTRTRDDMSVIAVMNVLQAVQGAPMFAPVP